MNLPLFIYIPSPLLSIFYHISSIPSSIIAFWYTLIFLLSKTQTSKTMMPGAHYWVCCFIYLPLNPSPSSNNTLTHKQVLPVTAGIFWSGMLASFMIYWSTTGRPTYSSMSSSQSIPYISDIGAFRLKPLFITDTSITTLFIDLSLLTKTQASTPQPTHQQLHANREEIVDREYCVWCHWRVGTVVFEYF